MKVLMLGWEFPPYNAGGLGIACEGLAKSFVEQGMEVTFIMPNAPLQAKSDFCKLIVANNHEIKTEIHPKLKNLKITKIKTLLRPYMTQTEYSEAQSQIAEDSLKFKSLNKVNSGEFNIENQYGKNLYEEVWRFSQRVAAIALTEEFDVIHAHDWMSFQAGIAVKELTNKPLFVHIHNTAYDRSGGNPNPEEFKIEKLGFDKSDKVLAISEFVKKTVVNQYHISPDKVEVVHNGIDHSKYSYKKTHSNISSKDKIVLFAGRVTLQKGPDYFIKAAEKVVSKMKNVKFIIAGNGDMLNHSMNMVAEKGLSKHFIFTGRYTKEEGDKLMSMANVFVMPSVSEPFGLVPLEAMIQGTPTIISKQSGVNEVLANTLKVDFWDTDQLANKITAILKYSPLHEQISEFGLEEVKHLTWTPAACKCQTIFNSFIK